MTRSILIAALATLSTGCASLDGALVNRVACTLDRQQGAFISWYGPIGISAKIADADAKVMCPESVPVILQVAPKGAGA